MTFEPQPTYAEYLASVRAERQYGWDAEIIQHVRGFRTNCRIWHAAWAMMDHLRECKVTKRGKR